jgi:hypothetical protein
VIRAHQPGSEPIDIPETIPNPVVVPKPTPTPTEPAPKEPVRIPEKVPWGGVSTAGTCTPGVPFDSEGEALLVLPQGIARAQPFVLSAGDGEFEYRIKSMNEPHERVVRESELQGRVVCLPRRTCRNFAST